MSTYSEILEKIKERVIASIPGDWDEIPFMFEIEKNSKLGNDRRYGVVPSSMTSTTDLPINNHLTVGHEFQVIITDNYINSKHSDEGLRDSLLNLYSMVDDLIISVIRSNIVYPDSIYSVSYQGTDLPELYEDNGVIVLRINFEVKYKKFIN